MLLNELSPVYGSNKKSKRVGRGLGSGKGKTCGAGTKGQKSRAGVSIKGFEGGQTPIYVRLPKRGFEPLKREKYKVVNLADIEFFIAETILKAGDLVNKEKLVELGVLKKANDKVKLLGIGEIKEALKFDLDAYSKSAKEIIIKSGGEIISK